MKRKVFKEWNFIYIIKTQEGKKEVRWQKRKKLRKRQQKRRQLRKKQPRKRKKRSDL